MSSKSLSFFRYCSLLFRTFSIDFSGHSVNNIIRLQTSLQFSESEVQIPVSFLVVTSYREVMLKDSCLKRTCPNFILSCDFFPPSVLSVLSFVRQNVESLSFSSPSSKTSKWRGRTIAIFVWTSDFPMKVWNCNTKYGRKFQTLIYVYSLIIFWFLNSALSLAFDNWIPTISIISLARTNQISVCSLETCHLGCNLE